MSNRTWIYEYAGNERGEVHRTSVFLLRSYTNCLSQATVV
jgi:hypothetical protein